MNFVFKANIFLYFKFLFRLISLDFLKHSIFSFKKTIFSIFILVFLVFFISNSYSVEDRFTITSPTYFGEQNNVYKDIHYLSNEYLSFEFCPTIEVSNLKFLIKLKSETHNLNIYDKVKSKCFFTNYNFDEINDNEFDLFITYSQDNKEKKIIRHFVKERQSNLINYVLSKDYLSLNLVDLSYYLVVLNDIENLQSRDSIKIYDRLKSLRDNSQKCWPAGTCSVSDTSKILRNLKIAGYDLKSRVLEDGKNYLEKNIITNNVESSNNNNNNIISDFSLKIGDTFSSNKVVNCNLTIDYTDKRSYIFDDSSSSIDLFIEKSAAENIDFSCDLALDNINLTIYNSDSSILNSESYVNSNSINYNILRASKNEFKFNLDFDYNFAWNEIVNCNLTRDNDIVTSYNFNENDNLFLTNYAADKIDFVCNKPLTRLTFTLFDSFLNVGMEEKKENVNSYIYNIPDSFSLYSCIGSSDKCNFYDTINSIFVYGATIKDYSLMESYINYLVKDDDSGEYVKYLNNILDSGFYLYYKTNTNIINSLKFKQNNDGSWGSSDNNGKILQSLWALLGLQKYLSGSEYVDDAGKWIYFNEPFNGWGSVETNSLAYLAIKEKIKPYLKINVKNEITGSKIFTISNPTIYNLRDLTLTFTPEIDKYLSYVESLGDLSGESDLKFNVTLDKNFFGEINGNLILSGVDGKQRRIELINMPVNIVGESPFNILDKNYSLIEDMPQIKLEIENTIDSFNFDCSVFNPFDNSEVEVKINQNIKNIVLDDLSLKQGNFTSKINCKSGDFKFEDEFNFNVEKKNKTFSVLVDSVNITSLEDFSIQVKNDFSDKQTLIFDIIGENANFFKVPETSKIVAKNDTREIFFSIINPIYLETLNNLTDAQILITAQNGYAKKIPLVVNLNGNSENSGLSIYTWIVIILLIITIVGFLIGRYRYLHSDGHDDEMEDDEMFFDDF